MKKTHIFFVLLVACFITTVESAPVQHKKPTSSAKATTKTDTRPKVSFWDLDGNSSLAELERKLNNWGLEYEVLTTSNSVYGISCEDIEYQYNYYKKISFYVEDGIIYQIDFVVTKPDQYKEELTEIYGLPKSSVWMGYGDVRIEYSPISKKFCYKFRDITK